MRKEHVFFIIKQSATVTETLLLHFLDYRKLLKKQVQWRFVHYTKEIYLFLLKTELACHNRKWQAPYLYPLTCLHIFFNKIFGCRTNGSFLVMKNKVQLPC